MEENKYSYSTVDEYISQYPNEIQEKLQALRKLIKELAPEAEEKISWRMPTYVLHGNLVHFAAFKNHIGFYPGESGIENFKHKFEGFKWSKGAVQFPAGKPLPFELISEIVKFRISENTKEAEIKAKKKK